MPCGGNVSLEFRAQHVRNISANLAVLLCFVAVLLGCEHVGDH